MWEFIGFAPFCDRSLPSGALAAAAIVTFENIERVAPATLSAGFNKALSFP
jgi:hypothetical protein